MAKSDLETALKRARRSTPTAATRPSRVGKKGMLIHIEPKFVPALESTLRLTKTKPYSNSGLKPSRC